MLTAAEVVDEAHLAELTEAATRALVNQSEWCCKVSALRRLRNKIPQDVATSVLRFGLCITSYKRTYQLVQTLPFTVLLCHAYKNVTVYLADYNEDDELQSFVSSALARSVAAGRLVYLRGSIKGWDASLCKNGVHFAAAPENDIIGNLDGDRLLGMDFVSAMIRGFLAGADVVHASQTYEPGTYGTILVRSEWFRQVGGYDESFLPSGCQDTDVLERLKAKGANLVRLRDHEVVGSNIPNPRPGDDTANTKVSLLSLSLGPSKKGQAKVREF